MNTQVRIEEIKPKKLVGNSLVLKLTDNTTHLLWQNFMPKRNEIQNKIGSYKYSVQNYRYCGGFDLFTPDTVFERWACLEVSDYGFIPEGMEQFDIEGGLYAIFIYQGLPINFYSMFNFIFKEWLPSSNYELDDRNHFEILGDDYNPKDPNSKEEIWIPIRLKKV